MKQFDASAIIYAWDNYPIQNFPSVWKWIADGISKREFTISTVAFEEVKMKAPECSVWLKSKRIQRSALTPKVLARALQIKTILGIEQDLYHPKGVGENDLLIIATAQIDGAILVTEESRQTNLPEILSKMKIPAVCARADVGVSCINVIEMIRGSDVVFN